MKFAILSFAATLLTGASAQKWNLRKQPPNQQQDQQQQQQQQQNNDGGGYDSGMGPGNGDTHNKTGNRMGGNINVDTPPAHLTQAEQDELSYMAEKVKMGHDVNDQFFHQYQIPLFENVRNSEQDHGDMVREELQLHGLPDPTAGKGRGEFDNVDVANTYAEMVGDGSDSLGNALRASAKVEETDIHDLDDALKDTSNPHLTQMYGNLRRSSENHLRTFSESLDGIGEGPYTPSVLSSDEYNAIMH